MNAADRELIDRWLDGELPPDEEVRLASRLEADPEAVSYLARRAHCTARCGRPSSEARCSRRRWPWSSSRRLTSDTTWRLCHNADGVQPRHPGQQP